MSTFEQICGDADIWIIRYVSDGFVSPVFLIWYTDIDENRTDKLLTFKTGEIFAITSLDELKQNIEKNLSLINKPETLKSWMSEFWNNEPTEDCLYDTQLFDHNLVYEELDVKKIEFMVNFINLFGDFVYQEESNKYLEPLLKDRFIQQIWDYYYNYIFWPRFNDSKKFESMERPLLNVEKSKLRESLLKMKSKFDKTIKFAN